MQNTGHTFTLINNSLSGARMFCHSLMAEARIIVLISYGRTENEGVPWTGMVDAMVNEWLKFREHIVEEMFWIRT